MSATRKSTTTKSKKSIDASSKDIYTAEKILGQRKEKGVKQYLVKWLGYPHSQNTWEPKKNLICKSLLRAWREAKLKGKEKPTVTRGDKSRKSRKSTTQTLSQSKRTTRASRASDSIGVVPEEVVINEEQVNVPIVEPPEAVPNDDPDTSNGEEAPTQPPVSTDSQDNPPNEVVPVLFNGETIDFVVFPRPFEVQRS